MVPIASFRVASRPRDRTQVPRFFTVWATREVQNEWVEPDNLTLVLSHFSCVLLCDPTDCIPPGFSVHGISQERILEWVAMPFSRGSSQPKDQTHISYVSCTGRRVLYHKCHMRECWNKGGAVKKQHCCRGGQGPGSSREYLWGPQELRLPSSWRVGRWCWPSRLQSTKPWALLTFVPMLCWILLCSSPFVNMQVRLKKKEMATHSSSLAWKIPWTEEAGRLQSVGSQRVCHDWVTSLSFFHFSLKLSQFCCWGDNALGKLPSVLLTCYMYMCSVSSDSLLSHGL